MHTDFAAGPLSKFDYSRAMDGNCYRPISRIINETVIATGITRREILGDSRKRPIARARQAAMYRCYTETDASLTMIGRVFRRDHTTIMHAIRAVKARLAE